MTSPNDKPGPQPAPQQQQAQPAEGDHVPEWAENMEHTLRRINAEKQAKRAKNPGLYL
jgi:truncated hemoglobin YjbI